MTLILLMKALKSFLEVKLADNVSTVPAIHLGGLPTKTAETIDTPEFPCIIIRPLDGDDGDSGSESKLKLYFCTKSEDDDGFMDVLNLMERVRIALLKQRIIDRRYRLELPYKWKYHEEQAEPHWIGEAITLWTLPTVQEEVLGI